MQARLRRRNDGRALFLVSAEGSVESVAIRNTPRGFSFGPPVRLFTPDIFVGLRNGLAPAPDGRFFIGSTNVRDQPQPASMVLNWQAGGRR
jgi:hypothetical protein